MRRPWTAAIAATAILLALAEEPTAWWYGYDLCRQLDIKPGSLDPILVRLADRGLLETAWETDAPPGRPPRHLYRLTGSGRAFAADLAVLAVFAALYAWAAPLGDPTQRFDA